MDNKLYNLLIRSFDDLLTEEDHRRLEDALATSEELRAVKREIVELRRRVPSVKGRSFKPFFHERVLEHLHKSKERIEDYFISAFRLVAVGAAVLVIIFTAYNIQRENSFSVDSALGIHHPTLEQVLALEAPFE